MADDPRLDEVLVFLLALGLAAVVLGLAFYYGLLRASPSPREPWPVMFGCVNRYADTCETPAPRTTVE